MPMVRALWVTCTSDGLDHLVTDSEVGIAVGAQWFRTLCGQSIPPAAMVCAPLPRCPQCRGHVDEPVSAPRRRRRVWTRWLSGFVGLPTPVDAGCPRPRIHRSHPSTTKKSA